MDICLLQSVNEGKEQQAHEHSKTTQESVVNDEHGLLQQQQQQQQDKEKEKDDIHVVNEEKEQENVQAVNEEQQNHSTTTQE